MDWITMKREKELGCRWNVLILTSRRRCEFDVGVSTLIRRCHYNIHDILWDELTIQCLDKAAIILWTWRGSVNLLKTHQIWRRYFNYAGMLAIQHSYYIVSWTNTPTLRQHWSNAVILTLWHQGHWNVVYWLHEVMTLLQRCHNVVFFLGRCNGSPPRGGSKDVAPRNYHCWKSSIQEIFLCYLQSFFSKAWTWKFNCIQFSRI